MKTISTKHYWIEINGDTAYFEHDLIGDDSAARINFEFRRLVDYSGCSIIPREVRLALTAHGYDLTNA